MMRRLPDRLVTAIALVGLLVGAITLGKILADLERAVTEPVIVPAGVVKVVPHKAEIGVTVQVADLRGPEAKAFFRLQDLSDRIGRYMTRNGYCPTGQRPVNLIPGKNLGEAAFVISPTSPQSDIYLGDSHVYAERLAPVAPSIIAPWERQTVHTITHEWAHVCSARLRSHTVEELQTADWFRNLEHEGLADAIASDLTKRICILEWRGCQGKVQWTYKAAAARARKASTPEGGKANSPQAIRNRRAALRGWR